MNEFIIAWDVMLASENLKQIQVPLTKKIDCIHWHKERCACSRETVHVTRLLTEANELNTVSQKYLQKVRYTSNQSWLSLPSLFQKVISCILQTMRISYTKQNAEYSVKMKINHPPRNWNWRMLKVNHA